MGSGEPGIGKSRLVRDFCASRGKIAVFEGRPGDAGVPFATMARALRALLGTATVDGVVPWSDPVVLSLSGMLSWLVAAEAFRLAYPAARRGRKVAYLTLAGFVFLVFTLATFMRHDSVHGGGARRRAGGPAPTASQTNAAPPPAEALP